MLTRRTLLIGLSAFGTTAVISTGLWLLFRKRDDSFATFTGHPGVVRGVAFLDGGKSVVSVGDQGHIQAWNIGSRSTLFQNNTAVVNLNALAVNGSATEFATVGKDGFLSVWDGLTGQLIVSQEIAKRALECLAWHAKSDLLATGGFDKEVLLFNRQDIKTVRHLRGHAKHVHGVAFESDGKRLFSGSEDGTLLVWNSAGGNKLGSLSLGQHHINGMVSSSSSKRIFAAVSGDGIAIVEGQPPQPISRSFEGCGLAMCLAVSPDGQTIVTGHEDGLLRVWDEAGGVAKRILHGHSTNVKCVAVSPDGNTIASGSADGVVKLWAMVS
jgi:WD40 repeat protein